MSRFLRHNCLAALLTIMAFAHVAAASWTVSPAEVDFGPRLQNQKPETTVVLTNTGTDTLEIKSVSADCSCTAAAPAKKILAPSESTTIAVAFETRSYQGELRRRVLIQSSAGDIVIPIKVTVAAYENWLITPTPVMLPPSLRGETAETTVTITRIGVTPAKIETISSSVPWLETKLSSGTDATSQVHRLTLTKTSAAPAGYHSVKLTLATTDPVSPLLELKAYASIRSNITIHPSPIVLPVAKVGEPIKMRALVRGLKLDSALSLQVTAGTVERDPAISEKGECGFVLTLQPSVVGNSTELLRVLIGGQIELEAPIIVRAQP